MKAPNMKKYAKGGKLSDKNSRISPELQKKYNLTEDGYTITPTGDRLTGTPESVNSNYPSAEEQQGFSKPVVTKTYTNDTGGVSYTPTIQQAGSKIGNRTSTTLQDGSVMIQNADGSTQYFKGGVEFFPTGLKSGGKVIAPTIKKKIVKKVDGGEVDQYGNPINSQDRLAGGYDRNIQDETRFEEGAGAMAGTGNGNGAGDASTGTNNKQSSGKLAGAATGALGSYGSGYYGSQQKTGNQGEDVRGSALSAVGKTGAIGGVIAGGAAIGDQIGKPIKAESEQMDAQGNLVNEGKAQRNAIGGGLFSPSKALSARGSYKGGFTDVTGKGYTQNLEKLAKAEINQQQIESGLAARDAGEEFQTGTVNSNKESQKDKSKNRVLFGTAVGGFLGGPVGALKGAGIADVSGKAKDKKIFKANGGTIKGKGDGKSDSILSKINGVGIPAGSFITPAENNDKAKAIRANILGENPNKVAQFKKEGGETAEVAVSNGEHLFTPKEKKKITNLLGEEILEELAPNAEEENDEMNCGGDVKKLKNGGDVDDDFSKKELEKLKAEKAQREKLAKEKEASDKKLSQKFAEERLVAKNIEQKKKYQKAWEDDFKKKENKYKALKDSYETFIQQSESALKQPKRYGLPDLVTPEGEMKKKENLLKLLSEAESDYNTSKKLYTASQDDKNWNSDGTAKSESLPKSALVDGVTKKATTKVNTAPLVSKTTPINPLPTNGTANNGGQSTATKKSLLANMGTVTPIQTSTEELITPKEDVLKEQVTMGTPTETIPAKQNESKFNIGNALEYGIPLAQTLYGASQLQKAGKRPVDKMDKDFINSVEQAKQNAKFGYTPEEQFAVDQMNQNLTNAGRFQARNLSGGSAAVAQSNERSAINQAYMRGLDSIIKGKQLQADKQAYADQMIQAKQNKSRQLFEDTLNGWNQNQAAGAALIGSGIQNAIGAKRYAETLKSIEEANAAGNAYKNIDYSKLLKD